MELLVATGSDQYRRAPRWSPAHAEPRRWLDVGGGHGHFCLVARGVWPEARFDVARPEREHRARPRRGWVDHAYRGLFPELAARGGRPHTTS